jgi:prevent-host-death family protein
VREVTASRFDLRDNAPLADPEAWPALDVAVILLTRILVLFRRSQLAKILPLSEVKTHLPELIAGVEEREEEIVVTKNGRPAAILVNVHEYARLKETLDVLGDPTMMKQIGQSQTYYRNGKKGLTFEEMFGEPLTSTRKRRRG